MKEKAYNFTVLEGDKEGYECMQELTFDFEESLVFLSISYSLAPPEEGASVEGGLGLEPALLLLLSRSVRPGVLLGPGLSTVQQES